jgi:hypothetical protein
MYSVITCFRTQRVVDGEIVGRTAASRCQEVARAQAGDARRDVEDAVRQLAGDEIGLIALRHGDQHVGVVEPALAQR